MHSLPILALTYLPSKRNSWMKATLWQIWNCNTKVRHKGEKPAWSLHWQCLVSVNITKHTFFLSISWLLPLFPILFPLIPFLTSVAFLALAFDHSTGGSLTLSVFTHCETELAHGLWGGSETVSDGSSRRGRARQSRVNLNWGASQKTWTQSRLHRQAVRSHSTF